MTAASHRRRATGRTAEAAVTRSSGRLCPHRVPEGSYCKRCAGLPGAGSKKPEAAVASLVARERKRFAELEAVVERSVASFVEVGSALMEIRESRLYRETHPTFEDYCQERWGWARAHSYRMIESAKVAGALSPLGDIPTSERHARELAPLLAQPKEMAAALVDAAVGGKPTARKVREAVQRRLGTSEAPRSSLLSLRVEDETKARWEAAAADAGYSLAEFIRACVNDVVGREAVVTAGTLPQRQEG